jgi:hypothetical protein
MQLFNSLIGINKFLFQFIGKEADTLAYRKTSEVFNTKLIKLHKDIESVYYNQILYPNLQEIWYIEKEALFICILCIISFIKSGHVK